VFTARYAQIPYYNTDTFRL